MSTAAEPHDYFWNHTAFKIFAGYLVGTWTLIEFLTHILPRLNISPHWTEIFLTILLLFIPSLAAKVFIPKNHSRKVMRVLRKGLPPLNLAAILIILLFMFWEKELGAMTKEVTYIDEVGTSHTQTVVKGDFIKEIITFPFDSIGEVSKDLEWLSNGIPVAIKQNVRQFQGLNLEVSAENRSLKEQLDELIYYDYAITGTYSVRKDTILCELNFYNKKGKLFHEQLLSSTNLFTLSDILKQVIIDVIKPINTNQIDIPFSEFVTDNIDAFKKYTDRDYRGAFKEDSDFAYAYLAEILLAFNYGLGDEYKRELTQTGLEKMKRLPERDQAQMKAFYFLAIEEKQKALVMYRRYIEFNSGDSKAKRSYLVFLSEHGFYQKALDFARDEFSKNFDLDYTRIIYYLSIINVETEEVRSFKNKVKYFLSSTQLAIIEGEINLVEKNYAEAIEFFELAKLDEPLYYTLDSLIKSAKFMNSVGEDYLDNFAKKISGPYFSEGSEQTFSINYLNAQLSTHWTGQMPKPLYQIDSSSVYTCVPFFNNQWHVKAIYSFSNEGKAGRVKHIQQNSPDREPFVYYSYRMTEELSNAFYEFKNSNYTLADSLFRIVYKRDTAYYFLKSYLDVILFLKDPENQPLAFENTKTFRNPDSDFEFQLIPRDDHYIRRDGVIKKIYPAGDGWLINTYDKSVKYQMYEFQEGLKMDIYVYDHDSLKYIKGDYSYVEVL